MQSKLSVNPEEYQKLDATALAAHIRKGEVSPFEALAAAVSIAEKYDGNYGFMASWNLKQAEVQAPEEAPLYGVPFLLKDLYLELLGTATQNGSRSQAEPAKRDSYLTSRYKRAGLAIFGKTKTPEYGLSVTTEPLLYGACKNPWNKAHSAGGSSGGAAAAVALGVVAAANASDGGGSIRIPASCCGLFGLKPSRGRVPQGPPKTEGWAGQSIGHVISRSVRDSALLLDLTAGIAAGAPYAAPALPESFADSCLRAGRDRLKIGFSPLGHGEVKAESKAREAVVAAAGICEKMGHFVEEAVPVLPWKELAQAMRTVVAVATSLQLEGEGKKPEPITKIIAGEAGRYGALDYAKAVETMRTASYLMGRFHQQYDLYLCPVLSRPPVPLGYLDPLADPVTVGRRMLAYSPYCAVFNQTGQPSASVPMSFDQDSSLPLGVLFSAAYGRDDLLLQIASEIEAERPWPGLAASRAGEP